MNAAHNFTHLQLFCSSRYPVIPHKCIIKILFISYFLHIMYAYMSRVFRHWIDCMVLCTYTLPNEYLMNSSGNDIKENWILCFMHIYFEGYWRISNLIFHWRFFVFFVQFDWHISVVLIELCTIFGSNWSFWRFCDRHSMKFKSNLIVFSCSCLVFVKLKISLIDSVDCEWTDWKFIVDFEFKS